MTMYGERNGAWADTLDPIVKFNFDLAMSRRDPLVPMLFNVQNSTRAYEQVSGVGSVGIEAWDAFRTSGQVGRADFDQGYKTTYEHAEYVLEVQVKQTLFKDGNFGEIAKLVRRVGDSGRVKRETDGANLFNNAFSDTFAGADAVGLCSTAHPLSPQKTGVTQSNEGTYALTKSNVATIREAMMAFTDDVGNKMGVTPDLILVPPALEDEAIVISRSLNDPDSGNNAVNPQAGRFRVQPWHYLSDSNAWFMIDSVLMKDSLDWWDRESLEINPKVEDKTLFATWIAYMRYSLGWSDWRWVFGSNPS
jgi:hypothetical protein